MQPTTLAPITIKCHDCQDTGVTGWQFPCDCASATKENPSMHKSVTDYAVPKHITVGRVSDKTTRQSINGRGEVFNVTVPAGHYYLRSVVHGYVTQVSLKPTAKSAINMMKKYCR